MESWAPQEGDHTSIASYGSVDKLKTGILSSSIAGVLLGQQEGIILLVSPEDQRSELVAEGPWSHYGRNERWFTKAPVQYCGLLPVFMQGLWAELCFPKWAQHESQIFLCPPSFYCKNNSTKDIQSRK